MKSPITRLIAELKNDLHKSELAVKKADKSECQRKVYNQRKEVLNDVLFKLETEYLNIEWHYMNCLK